MIDSEGHSALTRIFGLIWCLEGAFYLSFKRHKREFVTQTREVNSGSATMFAGIGLHLLERVGVSLGSIRWEILAQMSADQSREMMLRFPPLAAQLLTSVGGCTQRLSGAKPPVSLLLCSGKLQLFVMISMSL